jgi:methylated-DNA-[protein]-cysteine S-methyltransferase
MQFDPHTVTTRMPSPLGELTLAATPRGLAGIWFDDQRHGPDSSAWPRDDSHPTLREAARQLKAYFRGQLTDFALPLDLAAGTAFQQAVWRALLAIPKGATTSYGALAAGLGKATAMRAVGAAVGRNPLGIVVPCHRVIGKDGSLTGYAGGLDRKVALLQLEGILI